MDENFAWLGDNGEFEKIDLTVFDKPPKINDEVEVYKSDEGVLAFVVEKKQSTQITTRTTEKSKENIKKKVNWLGVLGFSLSVYGYMFFHGSFNTYVLPYG